MTSAHGSAKPSVLVLALEDGPFLDRFNEPFRRELSALANYQEVTEASKALQLLNNEKAPQAIILADAALPHAKSNSDELKILHLLVKYVSKGSGILVCGGYFSCYVTSVDLRTFFRKHFGVQWKQGDYHATDFVRNERAKFFTAVDLPKTCTFKASHLKDVPLDEMLYVIAEGAPKTSLVEETPIALTQIGNGMLGWVGDVNNEPEARQVTFAMCGLLPGSRLMSTQPTIPTADLSSGNASELRCDCCRGTEAEGHLKVCAKCKQVRYCSQGCQRADWKGHKKVCQAQATSGQTSNNQSPRRSAPQPQTSPTSAGNGYRINKPFHALDKKTWLYNRPKEQVYELLIDAYRLRVDDEYRFEGEVDEDSLYGANSSSDARRGFKSFLREAESPDSGVLPLWWTSQHRDSCVYYALNNRHFNIGHAVEKSDIMEFYGDNSMPMQLRMLAETIKGQGLMGQDGSAMREMMMKGEAGEGKASVLSMHMGR